MTPSFTSNRIRSSNSGAYLAIENPLKVTSPDDLTGARENWPLHANDSPASVDPTKEYGLRLSGSVWKLFSVISSGPTTRRNGLRGVISVNDARAPPISSWSMRNASGFDGLSECGRAANFAIRSEKLKV